MKYKISLCSASPSDINVPTDTNDGLHTYYNGKGYRSFCRLLYNFLLAGELEPAHFFTEKRYGGIYSKI